MTDAVDDLTGGSNVTKETIVRRVEDWTTRVRSLYDTVAGWLPNEYSSARDRVIGAQEELMSKFNVEAWKLPLLDIIKGGEIVMTFVPRGLFIIGANGRIDIQRPKQIYILVDRSERFQPSRWMVAPINERSRLEDLTRDRFRTLLP
jgi:hypothetical protein